MALETGGSVAAHAAAAVRAATSAGHCHCAEKHHDAVIAIAFMIAIGLSAPNDQTINTTACSAQGISFESALQSFQLERFHIRSSLRI
jgi:hypothetical protein